MRLDVHVFLHLDGGEVKGKLAAIQSSINALILQGNKMAHTMDEVLQLATDQKTVADGLQVAIDALQQQVIDALKAVTIPPDVQAKIDAAFDAFTANNAELAAALVDGATPVTP